MGRQWVGVKMSQFCACVLSVDAPVLRQPEYKVRTGYPPGRRPTWVGALLLRLKNPSNLLFLRLGLLTASNSTRLPYPHGLGSALPIRAFWPPNTFVGSILPMVLPCCFSYFNCFVDCLPFDPPIQISVNNHRCRQGACPGRRVRWCRQGACPGRRPNRRFIAVNALNILY